jgi:hypothetical protein
MRNVRDLVAGTVIGVIATLGVETVGQALKESRASDSYLRQIVTRLGAVEQAATALLAQSKETAQ